MKEKIKEVGKMEDGRLIHFSIAFWTFYVGLFIGIILGAGIILFLFKWVGVI